MQPNTSSPDNWNNLNFDLGMCQSFLPVSFSLHIIRESGKVILLKKEPLGLPVSFPIHTSSQSGCHVEEGTPQASLPPRGV